MTGLFKHPSTYSPAKWPPEVGELVIIREKVVGDTNLLNGFCGVLQARDSKNGFVKLLDSEEVSLKCFLLKELISTGKTPDELLQNIQPSQTDLSKALEVERSFPDFDLYPRTTLSSTSAKPKGRKPVSQKVKELTVDQTEYLKKMLIEQLTAAGIKLKN